MTEDETPTEETARQHAVEVGQRIERARHRAGLSQLEFADQLGVSQRSVYSYESGVVLPDRRMDRIAEILRTSVAWLYHGDGATAMRDEQIAELRDLILTVLRQQRQILDMLDR